MVVVVLEEHRTIHAQVLTFAANATGTLTFELNAGRTYGGSGCNTLYNYVENGWFLEVYTSPIPACQDVAS